MGMDSAQSFYFFEQRENGKSAQAKVITGIVQWRVTWGVAIIGVALLGVPLLNEHLFDGQLTWWHFAIAFTSVLFVQIARQSSEVFRLLYRPWSFIGITLGLTLLSSFTTIALILWWDLGIMGVFAGTLFSGIVMTVLGWWTIRGYIDWSGWHREWWPRLLRFGAPLVPAALGLYILNMSDRWFISHYHGQQALGLYAIGAKFALMLAVAVTTFRQAWLPLAMDAMHSPDGPNLFRTVGRLYLGLGSAAVVVLTALSPWLVRLLATPDYYAAYPIIGVLSWYSLFYGFYLIGAGGVWKEEQTSWIPIGMGIAAVLNIGLNFLLIPPLGGMGAAISTSISYFVWNAVMIIVSERLWPVQYPLGILAAQVVVGVATMIGILLLYQRGQSVGEVVLLTSVATLVLLALSVEWKQGRQLFQGFRKQRAALEVEE
jgi:O-antigen/teichoic acid export membrane protein